jgi:hypothetical protein
MDEELKSPRAGKVCHYKILDGTLVELGECGLGEALEIFRNHDKGKGDELLIGFSRDDRDFVELGSLGGGKYLVNSDRLGEPAGWWDKFFGPVGFYFFFEGQSRAEYIIRSYYQGTRAEFENLLFRIQESPVRNDDVSSSPGEHDARG